MKKTNFNRDGRTMSFEARNAADHEDRILVRAEMITAKDYFPELKIGFIKDGETIFEGYLMPFRNYAMGIAPNERANGMLYLNEVPCSGYLEGLSKAELRAQTTMCLLGFFNNAYGAKYAPYALDVVSLGWFHTDPISIWINEEVYPYLQNAADAKRKRA